MADHQFDLIVIGAGPGGTEAALLAGQKGLRTALISNTPIGGRATWSSLLPSKVWLATAEKMDSLRQLQAFAIEGNGFQVNLDLLRKRIRQQSTLASERYARQLEQAKVRILYGKGIIESDHAVRVESESGENRHLEGKWLIIATGSGPRFRPELKPNKDHIIAPKLSPILPRVPESLLMAGGGVTGTEYAYAFAALGTKVTILHSGGQLLPRMDPTVANAFEHYLSAHYGIGIHKGQAVERLEQRDGRVFAQTSKDQVFEAEYGFIAIGRTPDLDFYAPDKIYFQLSPAGMLEVNAFGQTNYPHIYGIGDVTGTPMMANRATLQARLAVHHLLGDDHGTLRPQAFIEAAYTNPPVGQVGDMHPDEEARFIEKSFPALLKANLLEEAAGMLRIKVDRESGIVRGAAGFGPHITDVLGILQIAANNGLPYEAISRVPLAHPSMSEILTML